MAELLLSSSAQSSLLNVRPRLLSFNTPCAASPIRSLAFTNSNGFHPLAFKSGHQRLTFGADSTKTITVNCVDSGAKAVVEAEPAIGGGGGGGIGGDKFGGDGGGGGDDDNDEEEEESGGKTPLSMSQKLTLGYAFLVGGQIHFLGF